MPGNSASLLSARYMPRLGRGLISARYAVRLEGSIARARASLLRLGAGSRNGGRGTMRCRGCAGRGPGAAARGGERGWLDAQLHRHLASLRVEPRGRHCHRGGAWRRRVGARGPRRVSPPRGGGLWADEPEEGRVKPTR